MRGILRNRQHGRLTLALIAGFFLLAFAATPVLADAPAPDKPTAKFEVDFMMDIVNSGCQISTIPGLSDTFGEVAPDT